MRDQATIGALNCRVRLPAGAPAAAARRMDRIARRELSPTLADCLADTGTGDDRVILVRSLTIRGRLTHNASASDERITAGWADVLVRGIGRTTADAGAETADVRVFADKAEWIAACIRDLLARGSADPAWWYGPLSSLVIDRSARQAMFNLVQAERSLLVRILARLEQRGDLTGVLDALSPHDRERLSAPAESTGGTADKIEARDQIRPILAAALSLLDLQRPVDEREALLEPWLAAGAIDVPDWQSPQDLADAVLAACRFIVRTDSNGLPALRKVQRRGRSASDALPWLDWARLHGGLDSLGADEMPTPSPLPGAVAAALRAAFTDAGTDPTRLTLRALARLGVTHPEFGANQLAVTAVRRLAPYAAHLAALPLEQRPAALLTYRNGEGPLFGTLEATQLAAAEWRPFIAALAEALADLRPAAAIRVDAPMAQSSTFSDCGGVAILLRALADVDLSRTLAIARADAPSLPESPAMIAAALLCAWGGPAAANGAGKLDPGLRQLLGESVPEDVDELKALLSSVGSDALGSFADSLTSVIMAQNPSVISAAPSHDDLAAMAGPPSLQLDPNLSRSAACLLIHWARWLRGFERSSVRWLAERALRRPGRLVAAGHRLDVMLPPLPLDVALRRAGYLDALTPPTWLRWREIVFHVDPGAI
jgi:hypothetical protein